MEEVSESHASWMNQHERVRQQQKTIEAWLGPSWGIKFELELSWTGQISV